MLEAELDAALQQMRRPWRDGIPPPRAAFHGGFISPSLV